MEILAAACDAREKGKDRINDFIRRNGWWVGPVAIVVILVIIIVAVAVAQRGGNDELLTNSECIALQSQFNIAAANNDRSEPGTIAFQASLGAMSAADDRMRSGGCYGPPRE